MNKPGFKTARIGILDQLCQAWQLLLALGVAGLLVLLKWADGVAALGAAEHWVGLAGVLTALLATCLLIKWVGSAAPALLFMTVFLVAVGYMTPADASACLKAQLADPFVLIVFSGFTLLTLLFGMPSERGTPPAWALRPGELVGRDGEWIRSKMGRACLRLLADPLWARLGALLPGFVISMISSGLGADAMARMAAIPKKRDKSVLKPSEGVDSEDRQNTLATVFVLTACVLAPALIPQSLWGMFFSMQAGKLLADSNGSWWIAASYPCLMAILLPGWIWWSARSPLKIVLAYYRIYAVAWAIIVGVAFMLQRLTREELALDLLMLTILYSSLRIFRRCWCAMRIPPTHLAECGIRPMPWWASKVEWELIKGGFSRALGVVVIVVFAAIFRKVIENAVPSGVQLPLVGQLPLTSLVFTVATVLAIGISIGTAFGTFVLGLALVRIVWPSGFPFTGQAPIMFWLLVSISAAVNQISQQADNVEVMERYADRRKLASLVSGIVLPTLAISLLLSIAGWAYCARSVVSWLDLAAGATLVAGGGYVAYRLRNRQKAGACHAERPRLVWLGILGKSTMEAVGRSRIAGDFIGNYDADNDFSNVKPENAVALLRTVPLAGSAAWDLVEGGTRPDALLLLIGQETTANEVLESPLVARYLRDGFPNVRIARLLPEVDRNKQEPSDILKRVSGGEINDICGQDGLKTLSRLIVSCLNFREGCATKPDCFDWLFQGKPSTPPLLIIANPHPCGSDAKSA